RTVGRHAHVGGAGGQVVELVEDLHGDGRADGGARRGVGRLLAEDQVIRGGGADREAGTRGPGQAGRGGADGVAAGRVQVQVAERGHATHRRHRGGAGAGEGARAVGRHAHVGGA